jgi:hypothetical protein
MGNPKDPKDMSEAELNAAIELDMLKRERDPQLRIADALEEIASQLQALVAHLESQRYRE